MATIPANLLILFIDYLLEMVFLYTDANNPLNSAPSLTQTIAQADRTALKAI